MKKIFELIKKLLGGGSTLEKAAQLQELEVEVKKEVEVVKEVVAEAKEVVEVVKKKVGRKPSAKTDAKPVKAKTTKK
jgi:hypothetical protein